MVEDALDVELTLLVIVPLALDELLLVFVKVVLPLDDVDDVLV